MQALKMPNPGEKITVRLSGWEGKDLRCFILGLEEEKGEFLLKIDDVGSGLARRLELDKNDKDMFAVDEDLECLTGKIASIFILGGMKFEYDLMKLEQKDKKEFNYKVKQLKNGVLTWYNFEKIETKELTEEQHYTEMLKYLKDEQIDKQKGD
jgi:hypothetical protein